MRKSLNATIAVAAALVAAPPVAAQEWTQADEDRSTILRYLERDEVESSASRMGVELQDVGRGVLRMDDAEAAEVADQVRAAEQQSAASNITLTTTTLIIILLVIILIAVIA